MVRYKHRYITVEVNPVDEREEFKLKSTLLRDTIINAVEELHGDFGVGAVRGGFTARYCNEITRIAIIRTRHGPHQLVASSLPCIQLMGNCPISLRTLYVGATLQHCYKVILRHQKAKLAKMLKGINNHYERLKLETKVMDLEAVVNFGKPAANLSLKRKLDDEGAVS